MSPWRRAPLLVGRSPALAVGVAVAAFVLALAGLSRPLFSASAGRAALLQDIEEGCGFEVGLRVERFLPTTFPGRPGVDVREPGSDELAESTASIDGIGPAVVATFGGDAAIGIPGADDTDTDEKKQSCPEQRDGKKYGHERFFGLTRNVAHT